MRFKYLEYEGEYLGQKSHKFSYNIENPSTTRMWVKGQYKDKMLFWSQIWRIQAVAELDQTQLKLG